MFNMDRQMKIQLAIAKLERLETRQAEMKMGRLGREKFVPETTTHSTSDCGPSCSKGNSTARAMIEEATKPCITAIVAEVGAQNGCKFKELQPAMSIWAPALQGTKNMLPKCNYSTELLPLNSYSTITVHTVYSGCTTTASSPSASIVEEQEHRKEKLAILGATHPPRTKHCA